MNQATSKPSRQLGALILQDFWFKSFGTMSFTMLVLGMYLYLLKNPVYPVTHMPLTIIDEWIGFQIWTLPAYLSLWVYVSIPPLFMHSRKQIFEYGAWIGTVCAIALIIFYFYPNAVPPANIDWTQYPGMSFLKGVDAAGNACPSLHVATAVFSAWWLHAYIKRMAFNHWVKWLSLIWCIAIVYSTMATKQHVFLDVIAGTFLGGGLAYWYLNANRTDHYSTE